MITPAEPTGTFETLPTSFTIPTGTTEKTMAKRDAHGRFLKKEILDSPIVDFKLSLPNPTSILEAVFPATQSEMLEQLIPKKKRAVTRSPYFAPPISPSKTKKTDGAINAEGSSLATTPKKRTLSKLSESLELNNTPAPSQSTPKSRSPGGIISCIPFPPLTSPTFGLIQERLAHDPFRLLIAVTFLNRTHGKHAIPVFYALMQKYPTPQSLVDANKEDIVTLIQHLGLQNQRATTYQTYAKIFIEKPPQKDKRYPVRNYPLPFSDSDSPLKFSPTKSNIKKDEILTDSDPRPEAWEIGHITQGPYALDSWRIFCRDELRGMATGWNGEGAPEEGFQPEWMRVQPGDKELRAFLRWMWLKEGFEWDPETGEKEVAPAELLRASAEGRVGWDDKGGLLVSEDVVAMPVLMGQVGNLGVDVGGEGEGVSGL